MCWWYSESAIVDHMGALGDCQNHFALLFRRFRFEEQVLSSLGMDENHERGD